METKKGKKRYIVCRDGFYYNDYSSKKRATEEAELALWAEKDSNRVVEVFVYKIVDDDPLKTEDVYYKHVDYRK